MREGIVPQCRKCLKHNGRICNVFIDPESQWRNGKCFGYVDRPENMEKMYREMLEYAYSKGYNSRETEALADYWHNIVTGKENAMPKKKHKLSKNDRDFIEENFIKLYHDYVSEKQEMEKDIIDSGYSQGYVELAHTQYNGTSVVETKVAQLNKSQRLAFLTTVIHAVDMAYRQCTPEQQKFMDMYYLSRRRYSNAAIREATGKSWKTLGRWRYRICERVARGIGLLD